MYRYFLDGMVHPERAQIPDRRISAKFRHAASGVDAKADVRILLNQVAVWVETEVEWNALDLRNVVKYLVQLEMDLVGYVLGHTYDVEIRRAICPEVGVDVVFGIDVPCISELHRAVGLDGRIATMRPKLQGESGVLIHRCLRDLIPAMKEPDDVAFHCYRAIESLRQHCIATRSRHVVAPRFPGERRHDSRWRRTAATVICPYVRASSHRLTAALRAQD
ncbi:hypothetical protein [Paraburkholderia sp. BL10I2N1]|uniref:hypothetical protein n=1 Tax=Paraburkholderia sp. BL10I2N1 TaxID=1938796 RepID=UPI001414DDAA|nr:hypothetical protein [Paraburkholderia sp. BL10I2N1]